MVKLDMSEMVVNNVVGFYVRVLCNDEEEHIISFSDFVNARDSGINVESTDGIVDVDFHVRCDDFTLRFV